MKKIIISVIALVAIPCALWAQNITANSTAEECLEFISKTISYGEHAKLAKAEYLKNGIKNTYQIGEAAMTMSFWYVDWASYRETKVSEVNDQNTLSVNINFDKDVLFHHEAANGDVLRRAAIRTKTIDFLVLEGNESAAQSIKQAAERLAELAKLKASPLLEVNASEGWAEAIPSNSEYEEDLEAYELELGGWEMAVQNDENAEKWILIFKNNDQLATTQVARIPKNKLKSIHSDGKDLIFTGEIYFQSTEEPELKKQDSFRLPLLFAQLGGEYDTTDVVHMTKHYLWKNGVDLGSDGYNIKKYLPKNNSYL